MVTRYTQQFLRQVEWGELDYLILDLPPGTGDIQLTIVQTVGPFRGDHRDYAPGSRSDRRAQGLDHVRKGKCAGARFNRKYELLHFAHRRQRFDIFGSGGGEREAKTDFGAVVGQDSD